MEIGSGVARSVLECGSPLPLLNCGTGSETRGIRPNERSSPCESARGLAQSKTWRSIVATVLFLASAIIVRAQSYSIDWFTIDGGGGTSTGGVYSVSGTIGQPDANQQPMTGGNFSLAGGFWSLFAVQMPGAPFLSIERIGGAVRVFWPKPSTGFVLDQSLNVTGAWSQVSFPYTTNTTDISITVPSPAGNKFYRLRLP